MILAIPLPGNSAPARIITLTSPNGGEIWNGGVSHNIAFTTTTDEGVVMLYYSSDGGTTYPNLIGHADCTGGSQTYAWSVPNNLNSTTVRVKVEWRSKYDPPFLVFGSDTSDENFTVRPSTVLRFTQVEALMNYGRYSLVKWDLFDGLQNVGVLDLLVRYRTDGTWGSYVELGGPYSYISPTQGGIWFMPDYYESAYGQLKIRAWTEKPGGVLLTEAVSDEFEISSAYIILKSPNGGENYHAGETCRIQWATANDAVGITGIALYYSLNSGTTWNVIRYSVENTFNFDWTIPSGISTAKARVKAVILYLEWTEMANDSSDGDFTIYSSPQEPIVTLLYPNPIIDGYIVLRGGEICNIRWTSSGDFDLFYQFRIFLSTDNGTSWSFLMNAPKYEDSVNWVVPSIDTQGARIRVELETIDTNFVRSSSVHSFFIFTTVIWNRPPVAVVGGPQRVAEHTSVTLNGASSYDPDGDHLSYEWTLIGPSGRSVTLNNPYSATPSFTPDIEDHEVTFIFELKVSDGRPVPDRYLDDVARTTVTVTPLAPKILSFTPSGGWAGTNVTVTGTDLKGSQIFIGGVLTATVPIYPTPDQPDPDTSWKFRIVEGVPTGIHSIEVRNSAGSGTSSSQIEIFPVPWYPLEYGFSWGNQAKDYLTYPWAFWEDGNYKDTFGNDVYISIWVCLGIPYWTYEDGWQCWGYEIEQPICPDPLAALWYGIAYCHLAQNGECFGFSAVSLEFYHGVIRPEELQWGRYDVNNLTFSGELQRRVEYLHGSQVSAECVHYWVEEHLANLAPSIYGMSGMGRVLYMVESAVASGELGVISIVDGIHGHVVVPYEVQDIDSTHTRIYVYDINKPEWSNWSRAEGKLYDPDDRVNNPPYIEIDKSGYYWEWSYYMGGDIGWWGGPMGLTFVPASTVLGDRTLPTTLDGLYDLVFGCATGSIESEEGGTIGLLENGTWVSEIPGGSPIWFYQGSDQPYSAFYLPPGNYTMHIDGREEGSYDWGCFIGDRAAYSLIGVEGDEETEDTVEIQVKDDNPYAGIITFSTSDERKSYSSTQIKKFGERERVYKIINASIFSDSIAVINTTDDFNGIMIYNNGPHKFTFDVEFQGNVLDQAIWEEVNGTLTDLPKALKRGITIKPYQTLIIRPSTWLDLMHAEVEVIEVTPGEDVDDDHDYVLWAILGITVILVVAAVAWTVIRKRRKA
ncbi:MAG: hypothetical protein HPY73_07215 [Methanomassiliicoccales archaeon]|nr:MAG: hypothetical protein HPY73_07215 [Methanomassiliicoccales archaeon]